MNGTRVHNGTETDVIMNYTCGAIFLVAVVTGLLVNTYLIYYYKKNRTSWSHRFYFRLAIAYWVYMIIRGVPTTYRLLDPSYSPDPSDHSNWSKELLEVVNIACYIDGAVITTFVAVIVMVQYKNIHDPGWTILHGSRSFWKPAVIGLGSLYLAAFTAGLVLLVTYLAELPGYLVTWLPGYLVTWLPGYLVTWLPGYLVTWLPGYLVTWLPGYLVAWQSMAPIFPIKCGISTNFCLRCPS